MHVSALFPLYMPRKNCSKSFRPEPFFRPKTTWLGLIVTQALVRYYLSNTNDYYGSDPRSYASSKLEMYILIAALSLFGGKSSRDACQIHSVHTPLNYVSNFYPPHRVTIKRCHSPRAWL